MIFHIRPLIIASSILVLTNFINAQSTPTFVSPTNPYQTISTAGGVEHTGAATVSYAGGELHAVCWDGLNPSFAIIDNGTMISQTLNVNGLGLVTDPEIVVDPRNNSPREIMIAYTVDYDNIPNNGSATDIRYEAWTYNGTVLTLSLPSTAVPSNTAFNDQSNIDISVDGEVAIVYHNGFNTVVNAIPDIQNPALISSFCLVELPCIALCQSDRPDVTLVKDIGSTSTKISVSFIWSEAIGFPPFFVAVHTFDYNIVANNLALQCDIYSGVLYESSGPDHFVGWPRIDGPPIAITGQAHENDYQLAVDVIEDGDISNHTFIWTSSKHNNGVIVHDLANDNNSTTTTGVPPWWTFVNAYPNNNPYIVGGIYGGLQYNWRLFGKSNFRPAVAYSNGMKVIVWEHNCKSILGGGNCTLDTIAYVGSPDTNILARQYSLSGSPQNPFVSIVYDATIPNQADGTLRPSVSSKFNLLDNILYVAYNEWTNLVQWKSIPSSATSLKRRNSDSRYEGGLESNLEIKLLPTQEDNLILSQSGYTNKYLTAKLFNISGILIDQVSLSVTSDVNYYTLNLENLTPGIYIIVLDDSFGQHIKSLKIVELE